MDMRDRIRARLEANELSVRGAAIEAKLGETTLRNYLDGMTQSMTERTIRKLAPVLGVTPEWLMSGEDAKESAKVVSIFTRVREDRRAQLLRIMETFADESETG